MTNLKDIVLILGDFNANIGKQDVFKTTIQKCYDKRRRLVNFAKSNNLLVKSTMSVYKNKHKKTKISTDDGDRPLTEDTVRIFST